MEDDRQIWTMLNGVLSRESLNVEAFESSEAFVAAHPSSASGCIAVDPGLPGIARLAGAGPFEARGDRRHAGTIVLFMFS
jgi:FixJ family two-component response regulator